MSNPIKDIKGQKFGKLTVMEYVGSTKKGQALWKCLCDCGNECVVQGGHLRADYNNTKSCGCLKHEQVAKNGKPVKMYSLNGKYIGSFCNITQAEKVLGKPLYKSSIRKCINKAGRVSAYGYKWEVVE